MAHEEHLRAADAVNLGVMPSGDQRPCLRLDFDGENPLADVAALAAIPGLAGAIIGKALYEGRFTVAEALTALDSSRWSA